MPPGSRRPWPLIGAALLLALLSLLLGVQWIDSRTRAEHLHAELRHVYAEAESLRTRAMQAERRVTQLEDELRAWSARDARPRRGDSSR
jgi:hypothetical protein